MEVEALESIYMDEFKRACCVLRADQDMAVSVTLAGTS